MSTLADILPPDVSNNAKARYSLDHPEYKLDTKFKVRSLTLDFFPDGNTSAAEIASGKALKKDIERKVYISCGEGWDIASEVLTVPETKRLIKALQGLIKGK